MSTSISFEQNALLAGLPDDDVNKLRDYLEPVEMPLGMLIHEPNQVQQYAHFPVDCIVSLMYVLETGATVEIAVVGFEGMVGLAMILGGETTTSRAVVQTKGHGYRIKQSELKRVLDDSPILFQRILRFTQALITLMGQTAVCNRHHSVEQQVCRWVLMTLDRQPQTYVTMTHELISNMLGVRREGVTEAAGRLQKAGYIRYNRGVIEILDRRGLEDRVCECYGVVKREFLRLEEMKNQAGIKKPP